MADGLSGDPIIEYFRDAFLIGSGATRLYLVRHAQSLSNTGEADISTDPPLTAVGWEQARRLAQRLARQGIDLIYSSPQRRALQTAQAIAEATGLSVMVEDGLREVGMGTRGLDVRRLGVEEAREVTRRIAATMRWDAFPGSEGSRAVRRRVRATIDAIARRHPGRRIVIVTHFGVIQAYVSIVLGVRQDLLFYVFNASITSVRVKGRKRVLWRLNDVAHLDGLPTGFAGIS